MKKKNIKIIAIAIMSLVILAGIVVVGIFGFNKELRYGQGQVINVYVEQMVDVTNIKKLVNECLAGKTNMVQTVEIYQDYVTIKAKEITEEQKNNIVNKLKENYEFSQTAEDTTIENVAATKYIDIYKKYIVPFAVSGVIVLAYIVIRYHKKGILKVFRKNNNYTCFWRTIFTKRNCNNKNTSWQIHTCTSYSNVHNKYNDGYKRK